MAQKCQTCGGIESFGLTGVTDSNRDGSKHRYWVECESCGADGAMLYRLDEDGDPVEVTFEGELCDPDARDRGQIHISYPPVELEFVDGGESQGDPDAHYGSVTHPNNKPDPLADFR